MLSDLASLAVVVAALWAGRRLIHRRDRELVRRLSHWTMGREVTVHLGDLRSAPATIQGRLESDARPHKMRVHPVDGKPYAVPAGWIRWVESGGERFVSPAWPRSWAGRIRTVVVLVATIVVLVLML